ncbi:MAG: hypothetical protein AAFR59_19820, partial [Bacteroidota bacterium]
LVDVIPYGLDQERDSRFIPTIGVRIFGEFGFAPAIFGVNETSASYGIVGAAVRMPLQDFNLWLGVGYVQGNLLDGFMFSTELNTPFYQGR